MRALTKDIDISTLHSMRDSGMTYKQMSEKLGCSIMTLSKYLGTKRNKVTPQETAESEKLRPVSVLKRVKEIRLVDLEGSLCEYHVNTETGDVEFKNGVIQGVLDKPSMEVFIRELNEVRRML